jgi:hypothetical protein
MHNCQVANRSWRGGVFNNLRLLLHAHLLYYPHSAQRWPAMQKLMCWFCSSLDLQIKRLPNERLLPSLFFIKITIILTQHSLFSQYMFISLCTFHAISL